jgi:hypothetical protein
MNCLGSGGILGSLLAASAYCAKMNLSQQRAPSYMDDFLTCRDSTIRSRAEPEAKVILQFWIFEFDGASCANDKHSHKMSSGTGSGLKNRVLCRPRTHCSRVAIVQSE